MRHTLRLSAACLCLSATASLPAQAPSRWADLHIAAGASSTAITLSERLVQWRALPAPAARLQPAVITAGSAALLDFTVYQLGFSVQHPVWARDDTAWAGHSSLGEGRAVVHLAIPSLPVLQQSEWVVQAVVLPPSAPPYLGDPAVLRVL